MGRGTEEPGTERERDKVNGAIKRERERAAGEEEQRGRKGE